MQEFQHPFARCPNNYFSSHARCTTVLLGVVNITLWVWPVGVAMVPDINLKKLEPLLELQPKWTNHR